MAQATEKAEVTGLTAKFSQATAKRWRRVFKWARLAWATFRQAAALFRGQYGYDVPEGTPLTPVDPLDWYRRVGDVPQERLHR